MRTSAPLEPYDARGVTTSTRCLADLAEASCAVFACDAWNVSDPGRRIRIETTKLPRAPARRMATWRVTTFFAPARTRTSAFWPATYGVSTPVTFTRSPRRATWRRPSRCGAFTAILSLPATGAGVGVGVG